MATYPPSPYQAVISLPRLRAYCADIPADDPRQMVAPLLIDAMEQTFAAQQLIEGCKGHSRYAYWECCEAHRELHWKSAAIQARFDALGPMDDPKFGEGATSPASQFWWRRLGFDMPVNPSINLTVTDQDEGYPGYFATLYVDINLVPAYVAGMPSYKDRRVRFGELYLKFLRYRLKLQKYGAGPELSLEYQRLTSEAGSMASAEQWGEQEYWYEYLPLSSEWWQGLDCPWFDYAVVVDSA